MTYQAWMNQPTRGNGHDRQSQAPRAVPVPPKINPANDRVCPNCGSDFLVMKVQVQCEPSAVIGEMSFTVNQILHCFDCRFPVDASKAPKRSEKQGNNP